MIRLPLLLLSSSSSGRGKWVALPLLVPDVDVLVLVGQYLVGIFNRCRRLFAVFENLQRGSLKHVICCAKLNCQRSRGNICLFHHNNLLFDDLRFTIYLQLNYLSSSLSPALPQRGSGEGASYFKIFLPFTMLMPFCIFWMR